MITIAAQLQSQYLITQGSRNTPGAPPQRLQSPHQPPPNPRAQTQSQHSPQKECQRTQTKTSPGTQSHYGSRQQGPEGNRVSCARR